MSAIHTGSIAVRIKNGRLEFIGKSEDHAITDWSAAAPDQAPQVRIPAQRTGNAYDSTVLNTNWGAAR